MPKQTHVYLSGNHDFAFSAFLKVLPSPPDGSSFADTWKQFEQHEKREGWYKGVGYEDMHLQGRRWGGLVEERFKDVRKMECKGSIYDAGPTFQSYGVPHGSADLADEHKKFLAELV